MSWNRLTSSHRPLPSAMKSNLVSCWRPNPAHALVRAAECPTSEPCASRTAVRRSAQRAQGHLRHIAVVHRNAAAVRIACNVVEGQDEAVVDVSDADLGL